MLTMRQKMKTTLDILEFSTTLKELSYNSDIIIDGRKYDLHLKITPRKDEKHDK